MPVAIRDMAYFLAVAQAGQLALVANDLGLTPAALSKSMRRMEARLGVPLFDRSVQGMRLSGFGDLLVERVRRTCAAHDDALKYASDVRAGRAGLVRIGTTASLLEAVIAPNLARLQPRRPAMRAQIVAVEGTRAVEHLRDGLIDLAVIHCNGAVPSDVTQTFLGKEDFAPAVREGHPLLRLPRPGAADLHRYSWIFPSGRIAGRKAIEDLFAGAGLPLPLGALELDIGMGWPVSMIRSSDVIAYMPCSSIHESAAAGICALPVPELVLELKVSLLLRKDAYRSPIALEVIRLLRSQGQRAGPAVGDHR
jgi:DNA-binding transcriptional LysR family regulator